MSYARSLRSLVAGLALSAPVLALPAILPAALIADEAHADPTQSRFAVIDTRRAIMETEEGLRVQANLKKLFDAKQVELSEREQKLQQEGEAIAKEEKAKGASPAIDQKKNEWRQKAAALQETLMEYQREMQRKEAELTTPMFQKMITLVKRVASTDGYDLVVDKAAVPYFRADLDITDKVIQMYNADGGAGVADPKAPVTPPAKKDDAKKPAEAPKKEEPKK
ncbi:MAG: OmpH family outer membrane protein [Polyangiaceae bacterium]